MSQETKDLGPWPRLVDVVARLRSPEGGCPWDLEQSHTTLVPYLIEEAFELAEAIERGKDPEIREELGDVLLQVVLHAQLAKDRKQFTIEDVIESLTQKMIRRHPHVFADSAALSTADVLEQWGQIKDKEKAQSAQRPQSGNGVMSPYRFDIPVALPALSRSAKIGAKTKKFRFDWPNWRGALAKVREELIELEEALEKAPEASAQDSNTETSARPNTDAPGPDRSPVAQELGDLLFAISQVARHRGLDPEQCLRQANARFENRFIRMMTEAQRMQAKDGRTFETRSNDEVEAIWRTAKQQAREAGEE